jgi:hypothetical protein
MEVGSVAIVVGAALALGILRRPSVGVRAAQIARADTESATDGSGKSGATVALEPVRGVTLDEPEGALIGTLTSLDRDGRGRMAVADRMSGRVSIYDSTGTLLHLIGRSGEGPGEFVRPIDAALLDDGSVAVAETGRPRITRYHPETDSVHTFRLRDAHFGTTVAETDEGLAVYVSRSDPDAPRVQVYDPEGRVVNAFHRIRPEYHEVPYWLAMTKGLMTVGSGQVVAGANLTLPFVRYREDGAPIDSVVGDLPDWDPVPRPEAGRFTGPEARRKFESWRRTFPTVDAIEIYRDSLLVVAVESLDPEVLSTEVAEYRAHIFDLERGQLVGSVDLPGRLLHADDEIHFLTGEPPRGWTVGRFVLGPGSGIP